MTEIIIELGHNQAPCRLSVKKLRRLLHKRRKVTVFVWKNIWKNIFLTIPLHSQLIHNHDAKVYTLIASCWHNNVNQTRLNRSGLHLTKTDTATLAQNFHNIDQIIWEYDHFFAPTKIYKPRIQAKHKWEISVQGCNLVMTCSTINGTIPHVDDRRY